MELYGLILAGGKSLRMGRDKGSLIMARVSAQPQNLHLQSLMSPFCEKVFHSRQRYQPSENLTPLYDLLPDEGPLGGLISAHRAYPQKHWMVVACDFPLVNAATISFLKDNFKEDVTLFKNSEHFLEPLLGIWSAKALALASEKFDKGERSPNRILENLNCHILKSPEPRWLLNINTPAELCQLT